MLGGVPRRVQHVELEVAHHEVVAVVKQRGARLRREGVLPVCVALVGEQELRAGALRQLAAA